MKPAPLSASQLRDISDLVSKDRLRKVPVDIEKAQMFLNQATEAISDFSNIASAGVLYETAYNASHDIGEALLAAYGYKTASGDGQHVSLGKFVTIIFSQSVARESAENLNVLRMSRNARRYEARPVGTSQSGMAVQIARELFDETKKLLNAR